MNEFPCPSCGATTAWHATYDVPESQTCMLYADETGALDLSATDYTGSTRSYDAGSDYEYRCGNCDYVIEQPQHPRVRLLGRHQGKTGLLVYSHSASGVHVVEVDDPDGDDDNALLLASDEYEAIP